MKSIPSSPRWLCQLGSFVPSRRSWQVGQSVEHHQFSTQQAGQVFGVIECSAGWVGKIDWAENAIDLRHLDFSQGELTFGNTRSPTPIVLLIRINANQVPVSNPQCQLLCRTIVLNCSWCCTDYLRNTGRNSWDNCSTLRECWENSWDNCFTLAQSRLHCRPPPVISRLTRSGRRGSGPHKSVRFPTSVTRRPMCAKPHTRRPDVRRRNGWQAAAHCGLVDDAPTSSLLYQHWRGELRKLVIVRFVVVCFAYLHVQLQGDPMVGIYKKTAKDIMTRRADTARPDEKLRDAIERMVELGLSALPVVDEETPVHWTVVQDRHCSAHRTLGHGACRSTRPAGDFFRRGPGGSDGCLCGGCDGARGD